MPWLSPSPASMPTARYDLAAGVISGVLYAVGGTAVNILATNQAYDPSTNTWSSKTSMPTARYGLAAGVISGVLYAVGGAAVNVLATNQAYDPSTNTWSSKTSMPTARSYLAAGVISGVLYAVGGAAVSVLATNQAYDPSTNTWSNKTSMPTARGYLAAGVISDLLYAVGGYSGSAYLGTNEAYNPSTNTWSNKTSMPTARGYLAAGVVSGVLYAVGGYNGSYLATNQAYDPSTNTWSSKTSMPTARYGLAAGVISGVLYAVGGYNGSYLATNEAYLEANPVSGAVALAGQSTMATMAGRGRQAACTFSGQSLLAVRGSGPVPAQVALTGISSCTARATRRTIGKQALSGSSAVTITAPRRSAAQASFFGSSLFQGSMRRNIIVRSSLFGSSFLAAEAAPLLPLGRLRIDLHRADGTLVAVFPDVLRAEWEWKLGEIGSWSADIPATAPSADLIDVGMEVRIYREGEGLVYRGRIASTRVVLDDDGPVIELSGYGLARELSDITTKIHWIIDAQPIGTAVSALLVTGWTASVEGATDLVTAIFEGATRFEAINELATQRLLHVRPEATERVVTLFRTAETSPVKLMLFPTIPETFDPYLIPITSLKITWKDEELINRVIPLGAGEGVNVLTLRWSTRTSPYPIKTMTGPDGTTLYYIEDADSISTYGLRERVIVFKNVAPIANSPAAYQQAANVLYDLAVAWLRDHATPAQEWEIGVTGPMRMRDPISGQWLIRPGAWVQVTARGVVEDIDGRRVIADIDQPAFVRGVKRSFKGESEDVQFTLSTTGEVIRGDDALAEVVDRLWAIAVHQKHYTFQQQIGPVRQGIDSTHPVQLTWKWDSNVRFVHRVMLRVVSRPLRSNATPSISGGGHTSSGGAAHSHSISTFTTQSGGASTSQAGSPHSHTVSGGTAQWEGAHAHKIGALYGTNSWTSDPPYYSDFVARLLGGSGDIGANPMRVGRQAAAGYVDLEDNPATSHQHSVTGITAASESSHTHDIPSHQHSVSAQTTQSESSHTHQIYDHTHSLVYGIYELSLPSTKNIRVFINGTDRTTALGGPWNVNDFEVDITQFLQTQFWTPVQQDNTIEVRASALFDIEISVRAIVTVASVVPV